MEIRIDDVNDNDLVFSSKIFIINVKEDFEKGYIVFYVIVIDKDVGSNLFIMYFFEKLNK